MATRGSLRWNGWKHGGRTHTTRINVSGGCAYVRGRVVRVCACVNMCVCRRTSEPAHDAFVRGVHPALPTGRGQGLFPVTQVHLFLFLFLFLFRISPLRDALQYLRGVLLHLSRRIVCPSLFPLSTAPLLAEASQVIRLFPVPSLSPIPATTFFFTTVAVICLFPVTSLSPRERERERERERGGGGIFSSTSFLYKK